MRHISGQQTTALVDELNLMKEAGVLSQMGGALRRGFRGFVKHPWSRAGVEAAQSGLAGQYGRQMVVGAGLGGIGGAALDEENRLRGALVGAGLGGGLMGARALATKGGREAAKKGVKRQLYYLTGKGAPDVEEAKRLGILKKPTRAEFIDPKKIRTPEDKRKYLKALKSYREESRAFRKGLLTVPGAAHGLITSPVQTLKSGWRRGGLMGKGFAGLGAYETARGFADKPEPGGPGRFEKGMRGLGSTVGWLVAPPAMIAGQVVGGGAGALAGQLGKGVDILRKKGKKGGAAEAVKSTVGSIPISRRGRVTQAPRAVGEYAP